MVNINVRDWDTDFFGMKIGGLVGIVDSESVSSIISDRDSLGFDFLLYRHVLGSGKLDIGALGKLGFSYVDCHRTLNVRFDSLRLPLADGHVGESEFSYRRVSFGDLSDEQMVQLKAIARDLSSVSRFGKDPLIDQSRVFELYEKWIDNSFTGQMANQVYVAFDSSGKVRGFVTFKDIAASKEVGSLKGSDLSLLAVDVDARGLGVGRDLVAYALKDLKQSKGYGYCEVVVSSENVRAIRFYEKMGYRHVKDTQIYHWHRSK